MIEEKEEKEETGAPQPKVSKLKNKKIGVPPSLFILAIIAAVLITVVVSHALITADYSKKLAALTQSSDSGLVSRIEAKLSQIDGVIQDNYLYDIDEDQVVDYAIKGYMVGLGDKYAEYYNEEELKAMNDYEQGAMEGIGVSVYFDADYGGVRVVEIYENTPAEEAGIQIGDLITYVKDEDGEYYSVSSLGYTMAMTKLRGPADTYAEFIVYRESENYSEPHEFSVMRKSIVVSTVSSHIHCEDSTVGVVRITQFGDNTPKEFVKNVESLLDSGVKKIIFDVRSNPGGELESIGKTLDYLLPEGPVLKTVDKNGIEEIVYTSDASELDVPMVVVCNSNTASAAELFCAALRDYNKAKLVGTVTYGKGCMQTVRSFMDGTAFKFTNRYYCAPYSENYDGVGITPDVEIELSEEHKQVSVYSLSDTEDEQIAAAYAELNK